MVDRGRASLIVKGGPNSGMSVPLSGSPVTLGRRSDNDLVVDEGTVSRRHALIMETPDGFVVRDLSTTNGTYVNTDNIGLGEKALSHGDEIRLAGSKVRFIFREEGPGTVTMAGDPPPTGAISLEQPVDEDKPRDQLDKALVGKDAELLALLKASEASVVSRDDIQRRVWPELPEGNIANMVIDQSIERLRAHVEDDPRQPVKLVAVGEFGFLLV
jgi:pSer/pThr/pTyr-binding forkhead associated (FHA) protein